MTILKFLKALNIHFGEFQVLKVAEIHKIVIQSHQKNVQMTIVKNLGLPKLISSKIGVAEKF